MWVTNFVLSSVLLLQCGGAAADAPNCETRPPARALPAFEQVRVSLGAFDVKTRTWSVTVSFAAPRADIAQIAQSNTYLPAVRVSDCFGREGHGKISTSTCSAPGAT